MKTKTIKKPKTDKQKAVDRLDKLFSEYIRKRAMKRCFGCERCHRRKADYKELDCAHFHTRKKYATRWHEDNAVGLCSGCHFYIDSHPQEKIDFFRKLLGDEKYDRLKVEAEILTRNSTNDYQMIELYLREKIKELE